MIKYLFVIVLGVMLGCGSTEVKNEPTTTPQKEKPQSTTDNSNQPINTQIQDPIKGGPADIKMTIKGISVPQSALIGYYAEQHFKRDTCTVKNETVRFVNPDGYAQGMYYILIGDNKYAQILLGEDQTFEISIDAADPQGTAVVKGSDENDALYTNLKYEQQYNAQYRSIVENMNKHERGSDQYNTHNKEKKALEAERKKHLAGLFRKYPNTLFEKFKRAGQNPETRDDLDDQDMIWHYRNDFWKDVDFSDTRLIRTPVILNKLNRYITELTPQNADSINLSAEKLMDMTLQYPEYYKFFANWIVLKYEPGKSTLMDPEGVFVNMANKYFTKERNFWSDSMQVYAMQNRAMEMSASRKGLIGPNVISTDQFGKQVELFDSKADYLVVYMYAPSCEHCQEETPQLVQWYKEWKDKGRDVFAIAIDTDENEWKDYIKKNGMDVFRNVYDPSNRSIYAKYYVDVTPEIYLLNKDRKIIGKNLKTFQIQTVIEQEQNK